MEKIRFSEGHAFIPDFLVRGSVCWDLGANVGGFASYVERTTEADVISVEPVSELFDGLPTRPRRAKVRAIVHSEPGEMTINIYPRMCASVMDLPAGGEPRQEVVPCRTLTDLISSVDGGVDIALVKLDIEGAEVDVLLTTPPEVLRRPAQYSVEFHDFIAPELGPKVRAAISRMKAVGFTVIRFSLDNTNVLFVRSDLLQHGLVSRLWLAGPVKYLAGARRRLARIRRPRAAG